MQVEVDALPWGTMFHNGRIDRASDPPAPPLDRGRVHDRAGVQCPSLEAVQRLLPAGCEGQRAQPGQWAREEATVGRSPRTTPDRPSFGSQLFARIGTDLENLSEPMPLYRVLGELDHHSYSLGADEVPFALSVASPEGGDRPSVAVAPRQSFRRGRAGPPRRWLHRGRHHRALPLPEHRRRCSQRQLHPSRPAVASRGRRPHARGRPLPRGQRPSHGSPPAPLGAAERRRYRDIDHDFRAERFVETEYCRDPATRRRLVEDLSAVGLAS
jgi:hypothetical protein